MDIKIRPACPEDASFLAWVILAAGRAHVKRGIWEVILGGTEKECLPFLKCLSVTEGPHLFHYSCFLLGEFEGRPVAGLGGYDPKVLGYQALREAFPEVFVKLGLPPLSVEMPDRRSLRILECIPEDVEGAWVIHSVATVPEFRRNGIMGRLLEEMLERGRRRDYQRTQISIYIGNTPAQRGYEKHGFKVLDEKRDAVFEAEIGSPGMMRLIRDY